MDRLAWPPTSGWAGYGSSADDLLSSRPRVRIALGAPIQAQGTAVTWLAEKFHQILRRARASAQVTASLQTLVARPVTAG